MKPLPFCLALVLVVAGGPATSETLPAQTPLPVFTQTTADAWLNGGPLQVKDLGGQVVLLDVWTFGCWNCYRSFPWLNALDQELAAESFTGIGNHSPQFGHERDSARVAAHIEEFGL